MNTLPKPPIAPVPVVPRRMTKQALTTLSRTLEKTAESLGAEATMIGTFQYETYFEPQAASFKRMRDRGVTTVAAYAADSPSNDPSHVVLADDDPLVRVWAAVLVSDSLCGYVHAVDTAEFADTSHGLEPARLFDSMIGFDPSATEEIATSILGQLEALGLDPCHAARVRTSGRARRSSVDPVADAWAHGMTLLAGRLAEVSDQWRRERFRATRDPLTGLSNREGLDEWIGPSTGTHLPSPPIGVALFDLSSLEQINDALGHEAGDEMLRRVGDAIRQHVRRADLVVRWGGDEFLVVCPGVDDLELLRDLAYRIAAAIGSVNVDGIHAAVDVGLQISTSRPLDLQYARADLHRAKRERRS